MVSWLKRLLQRSPAVPAPDKHAAAQRAEAARLKRYTLMVERGKAFRRAMDRYRQSGVVTQVEILGVAGQCAACAKVAGKVYPIHRCPELPCKDCSCPTGCRCTVAAVT